MENNGVVKHETSTTYSTEGRTFVVNAFDPMLGNYILMQILTSVLPMGIDSMQPELRRQTRRLVLLS